MEFNENEGIVSQENATINSKKISSKTIILIIVTIILVTTTLVLLPKSDKAVVINRPTVITPKPIIITATPPPQPSRWASDSAVLSIEKNNQDLKNEITNIDFAEAGLSLPNIDTNVDFTR